MTEFQARLKAAKESQEKGKANAGAFGKLVETGVYEAKLMSFAFAPSSAGRPQVKRQFLITEDCDQKGQSPREYMGLEHEVAISILTRFIDDCGYQVPDFIDWDSSEEQQSFVITRDFDEVLAAIEAAAPTFRISVGIRNDFQTINVLEMLDAGDAGDDTAEEVEEENVEENVEEVDEVEEENVEEDEVSAEFEALVELCAAQGIEEVTLEMDPDEAVETIRENYAFWSKKVSAAQIKDFDGATPADGLSDSDIAILASMDLGDIVIMPKVKKVVKKTAAKKAVAKKTAARKK